jgi:hypothetical protein
MTWNLASGKGAFIAAWSGMILAFAGWIVAAYIQSGKITVATLGSEEVMLSGNLIAIFPSGFIHFVYSKFVDPVVFDFDTLNDNIHLVEQDLSGLSAAKRDKTMIHKTKKWIQTCGYLLTFVLILLLPLCSIPAKIFTKSYFSFWVLLSIAWGFGAALTIRGPDIPNFPQLQPTSTNQPKRTSTLAIIEFLCLSSNNNQEITDMSGISRHVVKCRVV